MSEVNYEEVAARFQNRLQDTVGRYEADIILLTMAHDAKVAGLEAQIKTLTEAQNDKPVQEEG